MWRAGLNLNDFNNAPPTTQFTLSQTTGSQLHILTIKGMQGYITVLQH